MKKLTNREEEIMEIFWDKGPLFVKEVIERLPEPKPHYNTISTIIRGLEDKKYLTHQQFGNTHRYLPALSKQEYSKRSLKELIAKYFNKSYSNVVSMFVEDEDISPEEIKKLINDVKKNNDSKK